MIISLIAAVSRNGVIGVGNRLPWHLPQDLKRFRILTTGHTVIMGRKTYESIGRPLPQRKNIVISRNRDYTALSGIRSADSLESAVLAAARDGESEAFVIGGAEIYRLAIPEADRLYLTRIERDFEGDAIFPEWDPTKYRETFREEHAAGLENPFPFSYLILERV